MNDFIIKNFNFIIYAFEAIAVIVGVFNYKKFKHNHAKYFVWFLVYVVFVEVAGYLLAAYRHLEIFSFFRQKKISLSLWWYINFWCIGSILFFLFYYYKILTSNKKKIIIKIIGGLFIIASFLYLVIHHAEIKKAFIPFIQIIGAFAILICTTLYLLELLNSDKILTFKNSINFYITIAIFFWWLAITPLAFFENYNTTLDRDYVNLKRALFLIANVFMYSFFAIGLIVSKPKLEQ